MRAPVSRVSVVGVCPCVCPDRPPPQPARPPAVSRFSFCTELYLYALEKIHIWSAAHRAHGQLERLDLNVYEIRAMCVHRISPAVL